MKEKVADMHDDKPVEFTNEFLAHCTANGSKAPVTNIAFEEHADIIGNSTAVHRVYTTDHGSFSPEQLPTDLAAALAAAVFRKDGYIDRRHTSTRRTWRDLENWALDQFKTQHAGEKNIWLSALHQKNTAT